MDFRSYVISWNVTRRCNERCAHCYIHAGPGADVSDELNTDECRRVVDEITEVCPGALLILTGGEPLLRPDIFQVSRYAADAGLMVVMGTNGVLLTRHVVDRMVEAGIRGVSVSIDSLDPAVHDGFRGYGGAWRNSVQGMSVLRAAGLPFLVQTTVTAENVDEVEALIEWAHDQGAKVFNLYFLVPTGRGSFMSSVTPAQHDALLERLVALQPAYAGRMVINAKCAPHFQRVLWESDPHHPQLKGFAGAGGCPAGTQYMGIRPNGDMTPCPYLPVYGGNLRASSFAEIWNESDVFVRIRQRDALGGRCGPCEFSSMCSGCRARAYGATGDFMAEDPLCTYEPGGHGGATIRPDSVRYGVDIDYELTWAPDAAARAEQIPAFVRGKVVAGVEAWAREHGNTVVTLEVMHRAREERVGRVGGVPAFVRRLLADGASDGAGQ